MKQLFAGALALTMLSGCYAQSFYAERPDDEYVSMTAVKKSTTLQHFKSEERGWWLLHGAVPVSNPNVNEIIKREAGGKPVQNVKIKTEMSMTDLVLTYGGIGATVALVSALYPGNLNVIYPYTIAALLLAPQYRTVTVEGDVVKAGKARETGGNNYVD